MRHDFLARCDETTFPMADKEIGRVSIPIPFPVLLIRAAKAHTQTLGRSTAASQL
jgi:hypothetical protein